MFKYIIKGKEYKVKDNDTLDSIAKANGLTWQELAKFNFGTDNPNEINKHLRDSVGSRQKTKDGYNYILSSKDDPGIIYIPEKMPETNFASNASHTIVVKPIEKKTYVTSNCLADFRPTAGWKGEFGFDWMRVGDRGSEFYKSPLLTGGYSAASTEGLSVSDAEKAIKLEYGSIPTYLQSKPDYYVPYLNIFPEGTEGIPTPPSSAKLKLRITIEDQAAEELKFEMPQHKGSDGKLSPCFEVSPNTPLPTGVGKHELEITLKCVKPLVSDDEIRIVAHTREKDGRAITRVAGKLVVCKNSESAIKRHNFVLVKVWTDTLNTGVPAKGNFTAAEKKNLSNALFQALVIGYFADGPDLDLSDNDDFKRDISTGAQGKFYTTDDPAKTGLHEDDPAFFPTVQQLFFAQKGTDKFKDYFTIFAFGESPYDKASGQVQGIGIKNLIVFQVRDDCTTNHEVLHGFELLHSFKSKPVRPGAKFTFQKGKTDNVMDYTFDSTALITWRWQWKLINK